MQRCNNFVRQFKDLTNGTDKILDLTRRRPKITEEILYFALSHYQQDKRKGKVLPLPQCKTTNAHNSLELQQYYNTLTATCFGVHWSIIRDCTAA